MNEIKKKAIKKTIKDVLCNVGCAILACTIIVIAGIVLYLLLAVIPFFIINQFHLDKEAHPFIATIEIIIILLSAIAVVTIVDMYMRNYAELEEGEKKKRKKTRRKR